MPLTPFQKRLLCLLAGNRSEESHLAGGAALHHQPKTPRFSRDLDLFHDTQEAVATAYQKDTETLSKAGIEWVPRIVQPGFIRGFAKEGGEACKIEWCYDSVWRFLPVVYHAELGTMLHPLDLAINKLLALVGRDEPRDFLDILHIHERYLSLGSLCWAAAGKDPGLSPGTILELLARKGRYHAEDFQRLDLQVPLDLPKLKAQWNQAQASAATLIRSLPPEWIGSLFWNPSVGKFQNPNPESMALLQPHQVTRGGVLPQVGDFQAIRLEDFDSFVSPIKEVRE